MQVIINADDLGKSVEVNEAIFDMMARGSVTSATILANGPKLQNALTRLAHFPHCSFGVHLNADEFFPLSAPGSLTSILDESGMFVPQRVRQVKRDRHLSQALVNEFSCQIEKLLSSGVQLSHIDSHHHVHTIPWVFPVLKTVQHKYGICKVRISRNIFSPGETVSPLKYWQKNLFDFLLRRLDRTIAVTGFTDLVSFAEAVRGGLILPDSVELMVHPGSPARKRENELLDIIAKEGLPWPGTLINYAQL